METFEQSVKKEYKRLRALGLDFCEAHNKAVDNLAGPYEIGGKNVKRSLAGAYLRGSWRASVDRKIGIKSGRGDAYKVLSLDVWGNRKDGYEINQSFNAGSIFIPESASDRDILRIMREGNYLSEASKGAVRLEDNNGMGEYLEIVDRKTGEPIFNLELVDKA